MEELKENKTLKILSWIFVIVSLIHVLYATITMRGMYLDASVFMVHLLNNFSNGIIDIVKAPEARTITLAIPQIPVIFSYFVLGIKSKIALTMIYSFAQFFLPLLFLLLNWQLTKRTKKYTVFALNLFVYSAILITFSIFSLVETLIGATLQFILWNYLVSDIEYKKTDILWIVLLSICMYQIYEYTIFLAPIFLIMALIKATEEKREKEKIVKLLTGISFIGVGSYIIYNTLTTEGLTDNSMRFFGEMFDYASELFNINILISVVTLLLIAILAFKKTKIGYISLGIISLIYTATTVKLFMTPGYSINPMWETHLRTIPCWFLPLIYTGMLICEKIKVKSNTVLLTNFLIITLLCGTAQTIWQINNTYYWDKNIRYLKKELAKCEELLYIPSEHKEISSFGNQYKRRYIWHSVYAPVGILFSPEYKQKTLLVNYDETAEEGNLTFRESLYVLEDSENKMSIPFSEIIDIKNEFWDLTECAKALNEYNQKTNIKQEN